MWEDGICKTCGSMVEEGSSDKDDYDYMNRCTNVLCENHKWHYCYDTVFMDYYDHKR